MKLLGIGNIKRVVWMLPLILLFLQLPGKADVPVSLMIDGQYVALNQPAILHEGRVMVPLRGVFERLGATVNYDPDTHWIRAERFETEVTLALDAHIAAINGETQILDVAPLNLNGRILVPLRFVSEALGADVNWLAADNTVSVLSRTGGADILDPSQKIPTPMESRLISGISISPSTALSGQIITVTMTGAPGGNAIMTIGNGWKVSMLEETIPGKYVGTYVVPMGMEGKNMDAAVKLTLPNGRSDTLTNENVISIGP